MTEPKPYALALECMVERGAAGLAHPGGTLLEHLQRTARRLESWGAMPELVAAGACHAAYGTQGFPTALLARSERGWLRTLIGDHAESIVYAYCASDRSRPNAQRDRFSGERTVHAAWLRLALAELTAANELDVAQHTDSQQDLRAIGEQLVACEGLLSPAARAAVQCAPCRQGLACEPAADGGELDIAYCELGKYGAQLVLWHGGAPPELTWSRQRELSSKLVLRIPWRRDFAPSAKSERRDWELDARDLLRIMPGTVHVVAHSIGALSALVAAAQAPRRFASLVLIEPPVAGLLPDDPEVQRLAALARAYIQGDASARVAFLKLASLPLDHPETARIEQNASKLRDPTEAAPSLEALREAAVPVAIVSGLHEPGIERQCDELAARIGAQRWRLQGAGHAVQRHADFNPRLLDFLSSLEL
jgi:pimeloyl-ACP methyl ester carboxylesterase